MEQDEKCKAFLIKNRLVFWTNSHRGRLYFFVFGSGRLLGHLQNVWRTKTEVFEYDDVIHHLIHHACSFKGCYRISHRFSVFVWSGENDSYSLCVDAYFLKAEIKKHSPFSGHMIFGSCVRVMNREFDECDV